MPKSISRQNVVIGGDTKQYQSAMMKAKRITKSFGGSVLGVGKQVGKMGIAAGAIAVAAGAALTIKVFRDQSKSIDEMAKLSRSIGVTTETLEAYRLAGGLAGVDQAQLDKGIQKFVKNLGDAKQGIGTAAVAFKQMGINIDELGKLNTDEQLALVNDAIKEMPTVADKASASAAIYGKAGLEMFNLIEGGSAVLQSAKDDLEEWGGALTAVDAAKVEAANDSIFRVGKALSKVGQKLTVELAPYVESTAKALLKMGFSGGKAGDLIISAVEFVAKGIGFAADTWGYFKSAFLGAQSALLLGLGNLGRLWLATTGKMIDAIQTVLEFTGIGRSATLDMVKDFNQAFTDELLTAGADKLKAATDAFESAARGDASNAIAKTFADIKQGAEEAAEKLQGAADDTVALQAALDALGDKQNVSEQVDKFATEIQRKLETFGLSGDQVKLFDLANAGASNEQIAELQMLLGKLDSLKEAQQVSKPEETAKKAAESSAKQVVLSRIALDAQRPARETTADKEQKKHTKVLELIAKNTALRQSAVFA